jgi:hypothetical protein
MDPTAMPDLTVLSIPPEHNAAVCLEIVALVMEVVGEAVGVQQPLLLLLPNSPQRLSPLR